MTDHKKPETIADENLETMYGGSSGAGKARLRDLSLVKYVDTTEVTQGDGFITVGHEGGTGLKKDG